ncbi:hypothetical protein F5B18DRAFT_199835 [Nemania serpens]|nr:hypothetical protein F5B18DRAFT_199835 [Nemania serpens]
MPVGTRRARTHIEFPTHYHISPSSRVLTDISCHHDERLTSHMVLRGRIQSFETGSTWFWGSLGYAHASDLTLHLSHSERLVGGHLKTTFLLHGSNHRPRAGYATHSQGDGLSRHSILSFSGNLPRGTHRALVAKAADASLVSGGSNSTGRHHRDGSRNLGQRSACLGQFAPTAVYLAPGTLKADILTCDEMVSTPVRTPRASTGANHRRAVQYRRARRLASPLSIPQIREEVSHHFESRP